MGDGGGSASSAVLRFISRIPAMMWCLVRSLSRLATYQSVPFWTLFILLIGHCTYATIFHSLLSSIAVANTLLLLVVLVQCSPGGISEASDLFHRICGCVAFVAVLFMNSTHALEMLTENINQEHTHDDATAQNHDESDHLHLPMHYVFVCVYDVLLKAFLLILGKLPAFGLPLLVQLVLHALCPLSVIGLFTLNHFVEMKGNWFLEHTDALTGLAICVLSVAIIIPSFCEMKPYIFADTPDCFDSTQFQADIAEHFEGVSCTHLHVFRLWPGHRFEALIHINIEVRKSQPGWSKDAALHYTEITKYIRSALTKGGASKVVIEPRFVDTQKENPEWMGCVGPACYAEDRGCCPERSPPAVAPV